jgi:hypothetical protein
MCSGLFLDHKTEGEKSDDERRGVRRVEDQITQTPKVPLLLLELTVAWGFRIDPIMHSLVFASTESVTGGCSCHAAPSWHSRQEQKRHDQPHKKAREERRTSSIHFPSSLPPSCLPKRRIRTSPKKDGLWN